MTLERNIAWAGGEPIYFYEFSRGALGLAVLPTYWRYNSSDRDTTIVSPASLIDEDWPGTAIQHGDIEQGTERSKLTLELSLPSDLDVMSNWFPYPPNEDVLLTIYEYHPGEAGLLVYWKGRVVQPRYQEEMASLICEPNTTNSEKVGNSRAWQISCPLVLYGVGLGRCNANRASKLVEATLTAVSANGETVTSPDFAVYASGGKMAGGYIEYTPAGGGRPERRTVIAQAGNVLTLYYPATGLVIGSLVDAVPGCKHNLDDCENFHNNLDNYGGDPYIPERSPYDGNPVY